MTLTPGDIRRTIAYAASDDIHHNQPLLEMRPDPAYRRNVIECRGFIDLNRLGAFAADQLVGVMNGQRGEITEGDVLAAIRRAGSGSHAPPTDTEVAAAVLAMIAERLAYLPDFSDL